MFNLTNIISPQITQELPIILKQVLPEFSLLCLAMLVLIVDVYMPRKRPAAGEFLDDPNIFRNFNITFYLTNLVLLTVLALVYCQFNHELSQASLSLVNNMVTVDKLSYILKIFMIVFVLCGFCLSNKYLTAHRMFSGEYYAMGLFSLLGMMILVSSKNLLTIYLSLELFSLPVYAMVAMQRHSAQAGEAALKYFVMGAIASGILLFGISLVYGFSGTLVLSEIISNGNGVGPHNLPFVLGVIFICVGIAFKFGAAPFHMWMPDVYQGAPTAVTLFIATAPKLAAFGMAVRLLTEGFLGSSVNWGYALLVIALTSIAWGNVAAVTQTSLKRLLAYSGISHMGFILLGLVAAAHAYPISSEWGPAVVQMGLSSSLFYSITYALMSLAIFGIIIMLGNGKFELEKLEDYQGLYYKKPWLGLMLLILFFSMAGVPPFVGFFAKFAILRSLIAAGYVYPVIFVVLFTVIGAFYYLKMVWLIFFSIPATDSSDLTNTLQHNALAEVTLANKLIVGTSCLLVLALGLYSQWLMAWCVSVFTP